MAVASVCWVLRAKLRLLFTRECRVNIITGVLRPLMFRIRGILSSLLRCITRLHKKGAANSRSRKETHHS